MAGGRTAGAACSYLKAKHPDFVQMLESWASEGLVAEWRDPKPHIISAPGVWAPLAIPADERWFAGRPDMGSPVQLNDAERSRIRICRGDVFDANYEHSKWVVATQPPAQAGGDDDTEEADVDSHLHAALIVATPVDEATAFLPRKTLDAALGRGRSNDFVKERISATIVFSRPLGVPFNFAVIEAVGSAVTVAISETSRAGGAEAVGAATAPAEAEEEVWVLQSATGWARRALDEGMEDEAMGEELLRAFASALGREAAEGGEGGGAAGEAAAGGGALPAVVECHVAVWPYGDMDYQLEGGCAWMEEMRLAMAGDWGYNGRVEGAWLSGRAAAQRVVEAMGQD